MEHDRCTKQLLWEGDEQTARTKLAQEGLSDSAIDGKIKQLLKEQSKYAGVAVAYVISDKFLTCAQRRTELSDPSFEEMKAPFWMKDNPIGKDTICPRDGKPGCSLLDTLPQQHRRPCTHFLSWVWSYNIGMVREALKLWLERFGLPPEDVFLFMCFFRNNQFRILVEKTQTGSDNLEDSFEQGLERIGNVVALLDDWQKPKYLTRVWTIFEQYTAVKLGLEVTFILAHEARDELVAEISKGRDGIMQIRRSLCAVDAREAKATVKADEDRVKARIESLPGGFHRVNAKVRESMVTWIGDVVKMHMDELVKERGSIARRISVVARSPLATGTRASFEIES